MGKLRAHTLYLGLAVLAMQAGTGCLNNDPNNPLKTGQEDFVTLEPGSSSAGRAEDTAANAGPTAGAPSSDATAGTLTPRSWAGCPYTGTPSRCMWWGTPSTPCCVTRST